MTSLEKAKQYLARTGKTLAMRVAPLAVLAVGVAQAATFTGSGFCTSSGSSFSNTGEATVTNPFPAVNGITGFKGVGTCTSNYSGSSFISTVFYLQGSITDGALPAAQLPVHWDFTPAARGEFADNPGLSLEYRITFTIGGNEVLSILDSVLAGEQVTGNQMITTPAGATDWSFVVEVSQEFGSSMNGSLTLDVPGNSVDVGSADVPEPSSLVLLGSGAALLVLRRRLRR